MTPHIKDNRLGYALVNLKFTIYDKFIHSIKILIVNKRMKKREIVLNFDCRCSMLRGVGQFIYLYITSFCLKVITFLDEKTTVKPPNFWVLVKDITCFCLTYRT